MEERLERLEDKLAKEGLDPVEIQLLNYLRYVLVHGKVENYPEPLPYVISTVSAGGDISDSRVLDLELLKSNLAEDIGEEGYFIDSIGFGKKGSFGNSINIKMRGLPDRKIVNVILSQNGRMTLTGADDLEYGETCMKRLLKEIKFFPETFYNVSPETMCIEGYRITLINCDFIVGFEIDQLRFYEILITEYPYLVFFNPEIYRGIKIHFTYNSDSDDPGQCNCTQRCIATEKNGRGEGDNQCRKITCAVFETGNIIITGAISAEQLDFTYEKINTLVKDHYEEIAIFSLKNFPTTLVEVN